jgi:hypothetical protein
MMYYPHRYNYQFAFLIIRQWPFASAGAGHKSSIRAEINSLGGSDPLYDRHTRRLPQDCALLGQSEASQADFCLADAL